MNEYAGLAMVVVSWIAGVYLVSKWRGTRAMSISQHAASASGASKFFAGTLILAGFAFYYWQMTWFASELQLSGAFQLLLTASFIGQVVAAVVPDTQGWNRKIHRVAAYAMAVLYVPISYLILTSQNFSLFTTALCVICISYMVLAWFLFFFVKKSVNYYLIFQSLYIVCFQLVILTTAYVS